MNTNFLSRLFFAAGVAACSSMGLAQTTVPVTPGPTLMMQSNTMSTGTNAMPSAPLMADCKQLMADHKSDPAMSMDDDMKAKMKMCQDMHRKTKADTTSTDSSKMN